MDWQGYRWIDRFINGLTSLLMNGQVYWLIGKIIDDW